jgi:hypothetical protein
MFFYSNYILFNIGSNIATWVIETFQNVGVKHSIHNLKQAHTDQNMDILIINKFHQVEMLFPRALRRTYIIINISFKVRLIISRLNLAIKFKVVGHNFVLKHSFVSSALNNIVQKPLRNFESKC